MINDELEPASPEYLNNRLR